MTVCSFCPFICLVACVHAYIPTWIFNFGDASFLRSNIARIRTETEIKSSNLNATPNDDNHGDYDVKSI